MNSSIVRVVAAVMTLASLAACAAATGPAGVPSSSDVNPITGARGGTNGK